MYRYKDIHLEPIEESYLSVLQRWRNDERIRKWCRQNNLIGERDQAAWFNRIQQNPSLRMYVVCCGEDIVGVCGLTDIDLINSRAEFSLYIDPDQHKKGLGAKALKALLEVGFDELNLNVVWGETFEGNPALSMFEQLGFFREGVRRKFYYKDGKYVDAYLVSITRDEWRSQSYYQEY